jgi:hypothetical protein
VIYKIDEATIRRLKSYIANSDDSLWEGKASAHRGIPAPVRSSCFVFMARNNSPITSCVFDESLALIRSTVSVNRPVP